MPRSEYQKLKLLYIAEFFKRYSDEDHPITLADLSDYLEEYDISAERKSILRDIALLRDVYGMDIKSERGSKYYYLMSHEFDIESIQMLAECIHSAQFISEKTSKDLINTLCDMCSVYQSEQIEGEVFSYQRVKTTNTSVIYNVGTIQEAMKKVSARLKDGKIVREGKEPNKITFKYTKRQINNIKERAEVRGGATYKVSPFAIIINTGFYYMIAFDDKTKQIRTYRIDRMKNIKISVEEREGEEEYAKIDLENYLQKNFQMFSGKTKHVQIQFIASLLDTVIDHFGMGGRTTYKMIDKHHFVVGVDIAPSPQFYSWLCGFGPSAIILEPSSVAEDYKKYIESILKKYKKR